ncbi:MULTISPECIES: ABC transporter permease [unclassified Streptomyces]|uniref:ABC transporter permease n=1 Tax=unclassified Streptomyces TaxID=2593676 RepID=UPI002DD9AA0D|nr:MULTISPECIES: ABC transporter permease [unclassified Streptomyces]WSA92583.1 ABC transporter permease [Streptomyces sp. NBC_01795]WSB76949.1 ABC transporter permease [Streptomyces sp. NBC_01775]WSS14777.1 ABC transporter permease [Streptomyces sp. NBC_01186]WSS43613.1 ABC transporter permease [Streptomyces sp. NBC_01187]
MTSLLLRRLLEAVLVFFGVTLVIYLMVYALPGDPVSAMAGDRPLTPSVVKALREQHHLDEPVLAQYGHYLAGLLHGDLGADFSGIPVAEQMADRWPVTVKLALTAWALEAVVGIALGVFAALRRGTWTDRAVLAFTTGAVSVPVFVLGYTAQVVFGVRLGWFPVAGDSAGWPSAYVLPAVVVAAFGLASVSRLVRAEVVDNLRADYVRTAAAKGLSRRRTVLVHVLRNSLIPAVTYLAVDLGFLLGGTVIIEGVFNLPGIGQLLFQAVQAHTGPTVVGVATALILVFLAVSVLVDLLNSLLDPRIRRD